MRVEKGRGRKPGKAPQIGKACTSNAAVSKARSVIRNAEGGSGKAAEELL